MIIKTKSIQESPHSDDGVRICIMRRIKPEFIFDIWMQPLSPSTKLLKAYHEQIVNWEQYEKKFNAEVLSKHGKYLQILLAIAKVTPITLLCWEEAPQMCHRRLVAEELYRIKPNIDLYLL